VFIRELVELIVKGMFRIVKDGKEAPDLNLKCTESMGIVLTLDKKIKMYNGGVIDPREPVDPHFDEIILDEKGIYGRAGDFFISSSAEWISHCSCYLGWVWHNMYLDSPLGITPMDAHPNAPLIHPKNMFEGKITLENHPRVNGYHLKPGMDIAYYNLRRLASPLWHGQKSRYKGQDGATLSRKDP
jgi:deoxycytidine triphosphate deaminase